VIGIDFTSFSTSFLLIGPVSTVWYAFTGIILHDAISNTFYKQISLSKTHFSAYIPCRKIDYLVKIFDAGWLSVVFLKGDDPMIF
jgi:hypothetical protein